MTPCKGLILLFATSYGACVHASVLRLLNKHRKWKRK